ncbi:hypothetical protein NDU88_003096 [Pleurodeles waltl]|uniref:Uncharacterized protein n=1 Tax=Pleurodeles waltl TaxID=8319 RepID=A0AAV7M2H1_PLEWA|nr:hypothetical protein NDU88_003096 [Pleurodeles waltl]
MPAPGAPVGLRQQEVRRGEGETQAIRAASAAGEGRHCRSWAVLEGLSNRRLRRSATCRGLCRGAATGELGYAVISESRAVLTWRRADWGQLVALNRGENWRIGDFDVAS